MMDKKVILNVLFAVATFFALASWCGLIMEIFNIRSYRVDSFAVSIEYLTYTKRLATIAFFVFTTSIASTVLLLVCSKRKWQKIVGTFVALTCAVAMFVLVLIAQNNMSIANINSFPPKVEAADYSFGVLFQAGLLQVLICSLIMSAISIYFAFSKKSAVSEKQPEQTELK
jgi:peptidoglycan/LPS O-acetylase OafA/YrhL